jgi:hypothetical protein
MPVDGIKQVGQAGKIDQTHVDDMEQMALGSFG